ncbi:MAG: clan AA aspartic protease [bacterium]|nr:clan AA aspartic protease [bacterium]
MGITKVTVNVSNLTQSKPAYEESFLVDTGAIDCMAPAGKLTGAGIEVEGKAVYELANGTPVEYKYGFAIIELMGSRTVSQIIFGPEDTEPILGVVVLENIGIMVDPVNKTLKRIAAKPLK